MNSYVVASVMPQSNEPGPVPLPMATIVWTPVSRARASICSRSELNCSISRWAWESTNTLVGRSFVSLGLQDRGPRIHIRRELGFFHMIVDVTALFTDVLDGVLNVSGFAL